MKAQKKARAASSDGQGTPICGQAQAAGGSSRQRRLLIPMVVVGGLLLGAAAVISFTNNSLFVKYRELARVYSSKKALRAFITSFGPYAPLPFVAIQALQVVAAPIPGELTGILGGYVFGTWLGFAYSTAGLTLGSALAFLLARWVGVPLVRRIVSEEIYRKFAFVSRPGAELATLVFFMIPGFPKDCLCFLLGVSPLPFGTFFALSTLGRLPGTWLLSIQGAKVRTGHYAELGLYALLAAVAAGAAWLFREHLNQWMRRRLQARPAGDAAERAEP